MKDPTHSVVRGLLTTQRGWFGFLVVLVTFALYAAVASYPFLAHDDNFFVTENDYVKQGLTRESFIWSWTATLGFYHPLTWLSLLLDATIFGVNPGAFHLTNLWLHIANTLLLFHFVKRATGETGKSLVIAGLFAWHPINVETVAWVSERKGLLAMLFALMALIAYVGGLRGKTLRHSNGRGDASDALESALQEHGGHPAHVVAGFGLLAS